MVLWRRFYMKLVDFQNPILKQACEKFNFINPQFDIVEFGNNLISVLRENGGVAIAAPQVGVPAQIFVIDAEPPMIIINPKILEVSEEMVELEEACLTYPGHLVKVKRPIWIKVRYNQLNGSAKTFRFEGMTARIFQHEYEHLIGRNMFDNLSKLKKDMYYKKIKKGNR